MSDAYEPFNVLQQSRRRIPPSLDTHYHFHPPPLPSSGVFPLSDSDFLANNNNISIPSYSNFMGSSSTSFNAAISSSPDVLVFKPEPLSLSLSSHPRLSYDLLVPGVANSTLCRSTFASRSYGPLGPFTGYASILKASRFLKPAQMLLDEFCCVDRVIYPDDDDSSFDFDPTVENLYGACGDNGNKKSKLISMLHEVYKRYKQYYEQLQAVLGSFECVPGLGHAAPFAILALKSLTKHFKCLKEAITDQLQSSIKNNIQQQQQCGDHVLNPENKMLGFGGSHDGSRGLCSSGQRHGFPDHNAPVWRPHRGLPERAVTVLRAWLFDHFLHPYPTDTDKLMLSKQTGLSRNQVSNWFINARVRVWKPMVEEIHTLETRQSQRTCSSSSSWRDQRTTNHPSSSMAQQRPINSSPARGARNDDIQGSNNNNNSFVNLGNGGCCGVSYSYGIGSSNVQSGGVSLTLGLHHQNNVIGLPEQFPMTTAQRLGLDGGGGYEEQNRQFISGSNQQFPT